MAFKHHALLLSISSLVAATASHSAGFYLKEQSIVSQGAAYAGATARSDTASSVYFNPAGIAGMGTVFEGGAHVLLMDQKVSNAGTTNTGAPGFIATLTNTSTQEPLDTKLLPNVYYTTDALGGTVGLGISAPFGSSNEYDSNFVGSMDSYETSLKTVNISGAYAKEIQPGLRLGGSVILQTAEIEQFKQTAYGPASIKGDSHDIGWAVGLQKDLASGGTIGVSYLSGFSQDIEGTQTIAGAGINAVPASGTLELPSILSLGAIIPVSNKTDLMFDVSRYDWDTLSTTTITTTGGVDSALNFNYKDTTSISVGVEHDYGDGMVVRAGWMRDPTPTNDTDRSLMTPDGDRDWLTLGFSKELSKDLMLDFAYSHIMVDKGVVNKRVFTSAAPTFTDVKVEADTTIDIISLGIRKTF
jgi:long-chain fatty acid transport protein